jgi:DHA1 family multidrug resistance protein-like MFS transporter
MKDIIRDAPFGQLVRLVTGNRFFKYPDEKDGFECLYRYKEDVDSGIGGRDVAGDEDRDSTTNTEKEEDRSTLERNGRVELGALESHGSHPITSLQRTRSLPDTAERLRIEEEIAAERTQHIPIQPTKTADGVVLTDWYTSDDPENPQNWSQAKKAFVALQIDLYTFTVYCGTSTYVSSELGVIARFGASQAEASLGLALYVLGYGLGPLIWAPMSEIPSFGRNVPYIATFAIYMILSVPTALTPTLAGLLVCRFLQGFFGSPCLANGGASMQDMYSLLYLPYSVALWVSSMFAAPALGPILSGFAVIAENWRVSDN